MVQIQRCIHEAEYLTSSSSTSYPHLHLILIYILSSSASYPHLHLILIYILSSSTSYPHLHLILICILSSSASYPHLHLILICIFCNFYFQKLFLFSLNPSLKLKTKKWMRCPPHHYYHLHLQPDSINLT